MVERAFSEQILYRIDTTRSGGRKPTNRVPDPGSKTRTSSGSHKQHYYTTPGSLNP